MFPNNLNKWKILSSDFEQTKLIHALDQHLLIQGLNKLGLVSG